MVSYMSAYFLQLHYSYETAVCNNMKNELNNKADEIIRNAELSDEYSAELFIHDYIVNNCTYTEDAKNSSSAYGCLIENEAVCSGYSRAAMLLLKKAGIESMLVGGTGITSESDSISHMWNLVWIDGNPYHLDVTWDDPTSANNNLSHMYFNLTTEEISVDHKDISVDIECVSTDANYFVREKLRFEEYDRNAFDEITNRLISNIEDGKNYVEIEFSDD